MFIKQTILTDKWRIYKMKRRIKQFAVVCFVAAAISGTGNVFVHADYNGVPDKVTINRVKTKCCAGQKV